MSPRSLRRPLSAVILAGSLALVPAAARALPAASGSDGPAAVREQVRGLMDWLGRALIGLWAGDSGDNGMTIDPDGQAKPSANGDNGMTIDPNG